MVFKKISFQNRYVELETPPPLHGKNHLKFPFWLFDALPYGTHVVFVYMLPPVSLRNQTIQHRRKELKVVVAKVSCALNSFLWKLFHRHHQDRIIVHSNCGLNNLWTHHQDLIIVPLFDKIASQVDKRSLIIFPAVSILFNAGFWVHFLLAKWFCVKLCFCSG